MKFEDISRLADLVKTSGLSEIEIEENGVRLRISNGEVKPLRPELLPVPSRPVPTHDYIVSEPVETIGGFVRHGDDGDGFFFIKSPMVGTFYGAPAPDVPNFVEVNAEIEPTTVVCIIEAMKVMNEIQADVKGIIVDVLVKNGQTVEYGQPLFKVKKP
ncbi:MAG: acetyl-CoA carboxylase biotin carboxyl carrier protein [Puniceicoccales bacterium]|nr:acetyl-CoA carboxylase biotin carboxyl carrier protein [Puniceicoccales bacterium]